VQELPSTYGGTEPEHAEVKETCAFINGSIAKIK
jgi:hypothetical protein